ncbi:MAG: flagellin [Thermoguttaceae bacterium]|jgi:flagellin|nr:flagellin [Thermoguttaceae bacterium]
MTRINTNVSSLIAQKTLARTNNQLQQALTRLSTGLRINVGKDDPAGLIASETLRSDIVSTQRAITNSERANQMIATADSAIGQVSSLLNDIRGLVTEAANQGAMSADQIAANQLQIDSSLEAINRIAQTTSFQGKRLLDGSLDFVTTADTVSSITDLQIDQANLGAAGQITVDVEISTAATQATITSASGEATASATLYFAARGTSTLTTSGTGGALDIRAKSLSPEYDGVSIVFNGAASSASASYDSESKILTVNFNDTTTTVTQLVAAINATNEFEAASTATGTDTVTSATNVTTNQEYLTITAPSAGTDYNGVEISVQTSASVAAGSPTAVYYADTKRLVLTINDTDATALSDIATAITNQTDFTATASVGATNIYGGGTADKKAVASTLGTGYLTSGFSSATNAYGTLNFAAGKAFTLTTSGGSAVIDIKAKSVGTAESDVNVILDGSKTSTSATYNSATKTLTVEYNDTTTTVAELVAAINTVSQFDARVRSGTGTDTVTTASASGTTGVDSIKVTSLIPGADFNNMNIRIQRQDGLGAANPTAAYDSANNVLTITIDSTAATTLANIASAIDAVEGFSAAYSTTGAGVIFGDNTEATVTANTGSTGGNALLANTVMEIAGNKGMEVFNFQAGTSVNQMVAAINLVSDATGLSASQSLGVMTLTSSDYGSKALAAVTVTSEGSGGTFKSALSATRANGTDIVARINGVKANADGNTMSINTATLDMTLTVAAGTTGVLEFVISGGGALFQLGPDVVTNQQARIGIASLNTARLGGTSGKLYQLASGESAALATDPTKAAAIVDETITKVTSLRGRLGAFQRTTLDTNINSLSDTVENLTAAESAIRDADFAAESAALTRAQILVQSGTAVLAIANQNPQNVLALLR